MDGMPTNDGRLFGDDGRAAGALRPLIAVAVIYYGVETGSFAGPVWQTGALSVGIAAWVFAMMARFLSHSRGILWVVGAMVMLPAGALGDDQFGVGWILFCVATFMLFSRGTTVVRARLSMVVWAPSAILLLALRIREHPSWESFLGNALGVAGVMLLSIIRRQTHQRRRQDRELAARSRELEERNAALIEQTEMTRAEAARRAALEERGRIARDIHDLLAHSLGGLVIQLDAAEAELSAAGDPERVAERLRASQAIARDGL